MTALRRRSNNFNLIRLFLALLVLLAHAPEMIDGNRGREIFTRIFHSDISSGTIAVSGFFILSGYLISKSWVENPKILPFLEKRILRIFPAFLAASLVCALIVGPLGAASVSQYFIDLKWGDFMWGAIGLQQPVIPAIFIGQPYPYVNGAMWTIPIEFACYLSVLVLGIARGFKPSLCLATMLTLLVISAVDSFGFYLSIVQRVSLDLAGYFSVGCCFYVFRDRIHFSKNAALILGCVVFMGFYWFQGKQLIFSLAGAYVLFFLAFANIPALQNFNNLPDVSYGVYLYGWPIQKLLIWWLPGISPWIVFVASAILSIAAGWISWHVVEKRFLALKRQTTRPVEIAVSDVPGPMK